MKTLDIQYRQAQSVNIDLGMLDIALYFGGRADNLEDFMGDFNLCWNFNCSEKGNQILSHFDKFI